MATTRRTDEKTKTLMSAARKAAANATRKWRAVDREDLEQQTLEQMLKRPPPDDVELVNFATSIADRLAGKEVRHTKTAGSHAQRASRALTRKAASDDSPRGRPKSHRLSSDQLKLAVRAKCEKEFQQFTKRPWDQQLAPLVHRDDSNSNGAVEREAQEIVHNLLVAVHRAHRFAGTRKDPAIMGWNAWSVLRHQLLPLLRPILMHDTFSRVKVPQDIRSKTQQEALSDPNVEFELPVFPEPIASHLVRFIYLWEVKRDVLNLGRTMSDRELAVVAILGELWPELHPGIDTVAKVIENQTAAIRKTREKWGRHTTAIEKWLHGGGQKPKNVVYVVFDVNGQLDERNQAAPTHAELARFSTLEEATRDCEARWPGARLATAAPFDPGHWDVLSDDLERVAFVRVVLTERKKTRAVPD